MYVAVVVTYSLLSSAAPTLSLCSVFISETNSRARTNSVRPPFLPPALTAPAARNQIVPFFIDCFTQSQHFLHFPRWWGPHWPPIGRAQFAPPIGAQWAGLSSSWRDLEEVILTASTASHPGQPGPPSAKKVNLNNRFCSATTFSQSSGRPAGLGGTDSASNNSDINNNNIAISIVSQPHQCTQQTLV